MHEFSAEHAGRWDAWQSANAASARRSDRTAGLFGITLLAATLAAFAVTVWQ